MANHSVKVPQQEGEITIAVAGESTTYKVSDHTVTVKESDLATFLTTVDDSHVVEGKPGK